ncbi:MAG TPA: flagellar hook-associated protein FlgK [Candidatus Nanopelagicaceae bacterium]|nr:flagellar hook-associated protein FlgK [Candidatus Nanopelagicaceae bacterium]
MSSFESLSVALSSLYAQRRGLDVTGQNIANANTDGYSRQRIELTAVGAPAIPAVWSTWSGAGSGVSVDGLTRLRDAFLETRGRDTQASLSQFTTASQTLNQVQQLIPEPGTNGFQSILSNLWSGFADLANNPGDSSARTQLLQRAGAVSDWLNTTQSSMASQWSAMHDQLSALVSEVNSATHGVADLNQAIQSATLSGLPANELSDQRDLLAMKLANLVGASSTVGTDGMLSVQLQGSSLVRGNVAQDIAVNSIPAGLLDVTAGTQVQITLASGGQPLPVATGQAGAILDSLNNVLPGYSARLDGVAAKLANAVNTQQTAGYDLAGNPGIPLFTGTTAGTIKVAITDPKLLAASGVAGAANLDGSNATALSNLANQVGGPDEVYQKFVVDLGVATQTAARRVDSQTAISNQINAARESQAGVNIDEEMTNMISFQRGYEAAGRLMTAVDSTLDTLINHTGLVGR